MSCFGPRRRESDGVSAMPHESLRVSRRRRSAQIIDKIGPYIEMEAFTPAQVQKASKACTAMCMWVRAMHKYHQVSVMVEPKKKLLAEATAELEETMQKLAEVLTQRRK